ncbi:MAG: helix-turn-helix transcriptional regulator [Bacteroidota bacterium]
MVNRILLVLKIKNLSPSKFADEIGIQRSSMSHIMSGRNLPSLDLILKILQKFKDINSEWLMQGVGPMLKTTQIDLFEVEEDMKDEILKKEAKEKEPSVELKNDKEKSEVIINEQETKVRNQDVQVENSDYKTTTDENLAKIPQSISSEIEKIVILYKNNTFKEYHPGL